MAGKGIEAKAKGIVGKKIAGRPLILWVGVAAAAYFLFLHFKGGTKTTSPNADPNAQLATPSGGSVSGGGAPSDTGSNSGSSSTDLYAALLGQYAEVSSGYYNALSAEQSNNSALLSFLSQAPNPGLASSTDSHNSSTTTNITNNGTGDSKPSVPASTTSAAPPSISEQLINTSAAIAAQSWSDVSPKANSAGSTTGRVNVNVANQALAEPAHTAAVGAAQKASADKSKAQKAAVVSQGALNSPH